MWLSLGVQGAAACVALWLIRITGRRWAWGLIASALGLMVARRIVTIYHIRSGDPRYTLDFTAELIALGVSATMLLGIIAIVPMFRAMRRSREELSEAHARFRQLTEATREGVVVHENGCIVDANPAAAQLLGYTQQELIGCSLNDFIAPEAWDTVNRRIDQNIVEPFEHDLIRKDGSRVTVESCAREMQIGGRRIRVATLRDITERKAAERALEDNQRAMATLLANLPGMAYRCLCDEQWTMQFISDGCHELTGYQPDDLIENRVTSFAELTHPDDRLPVRNQVEAALRERSPFQLTYRIRTAEGVEKWVWEQGVGVFDDSGVLVALEGFITDITDRQRSERALRTAHNELESRVRERTADLESAKSVLEGEIIERERVAAALRESEERFRYLCNSAPIGIFLTNPEGEAIYVNPRLRNIAGLTADDAMGWGWLSKLHPEDRERIEKEARQSAGSGAEFRGEFRILRGDVDVRWVFVQSARIVSTDGTFRGKVGTVEDITERKLAEAALRESEQRLQGVLDNTPAVVYVKGAGGRYLLINRRYEELFHVSNEDIVGKSDLEILSREVAEAVRANDRLVLEQKRPIEFEEMVPRDGEERYYISLKFPLFDEHGNPYAVCGISTDITERKRVEEAIRHQQMEQQAILDSAPVLIWYKSRDDLIVRVNKAAAESIGLSVRDIEGRYTKEIYPEDAERYRRDDMEVIESGVPKLGIVEQLRTASGEKIWVRTDKAPLSDEAGNIIGVIVVAQDITDRVRVEEALRESTAQLEALAQEQRTLIEHTRDFLYRHDTKGVFNYVSPSIEQITGYTVDEWRTHYTAFLTDNPINRQVVERTEETMRTGRESPPYLLELMHKDGHSIMLEVNERPFFEEGRVAGVIGVARDVTERVHAAEAMQKAKETAEAASRAKSMFLANVSHEIRTPIMALLSAAELWRPEQHDEAGWSRRNIILRNGRHLQSLVDEILDLARVDADRLEVRVGECSLLEIMADVQAVAAPLERSPNVEFKIFYDTPVPAVIHTDATRVKQAVINLIRNALKFTQRGHVHVHVRVGDVAGRPMLNIVVEDTGVGIAAQQLDRIFETFAQIEPAEGRVSEGAGLGLPLARGIAKQLGGDIEVVSEPGKGSTFTFSVEAGPVQDATWIQPERDADQIWRGLDASSPAESVQLNGTVLLAEDFRDTRELIRYALAHAGARVTAVVNGRLAVEAVTERAFDLILMDVRMPEMDGPTAAREIRKLGYRGTMIALTASTTAAERSSIVDAGFDDLWTKPMPLHEIIEKASAYLESSAHSGIPTGRIDVGRGTGNLSDPDQNTEHQQADRRDGRGRSGASEKVETPELGPGRRGEGIAKLSESWRASGSEAPRASGRRSDGFAERLAEIVAEFALSLPERAAEVRRLVERGEVQQARELLHQLAGSGGIHGFMSISEEAARLLKLARSGELASKPEELTRIEELSATIADSVRR
jgi:PAS domain S-box-containing protein